MAYCLLSQLPSCTSNGKRERFRRPRQDGNALLRRNTATIKSLFRKNLDVLARKNTLDAAALIESAQALRDEIVNALDVMLNEVIEQARRARDGRPPEDAPPAAPEAPPVDKSVQRGVDKSVPPQSSADEHSAQSEPVDMQVSSLSQSAASPPESANVAEISSVHRRVDRFVSPTGMDLSIGGDESVHSLNTGIYGQGTQGGQPNLLDAQVSDHLREALVDVATFESVGVISFDVSILDGSKKLRSYYGRVPVDGLRRMMPSLLHRCEKDMLNLIIRPRVGADRRLIQLDDLNHAAVEKLREFAFRIIETSLGNYQVWLCVLGGHEETEKRLKKVAGADVGATGATRLAGLMNVKEQRRGPDRSYPRVRLIDSEARVVSVKEIAGVLGSDEMPPCVSTPERRSRLPMPDYQEFVNRARLSSTGKIDRSMIDYSWAATALSRGHSVEDVTLELDRVSLKTASLSGNARESYVRRTVGAAAKESGCKSMR